MERYLLFFCFANEGKIKLGFQNGQKSYRNGLEYERQAGHFVIGDAEVGQPLAHRGDEVREASAGDGAARAARRRL